MDQQNYILPKDNTGFVNVYTDGACSGNGRTSPKGGIGVFFEDNHPLNISAPLTGKQTNNLAEIQAATQAVLQAKKAGVSKLRINTDSKYLINSCTEWIPRWKENGWITSSGRPVKNREELQFLENTTKNLEISWIHVPGHQGHPGNSKADELARSGIRKPISDDI
ncbi:ribonuclease H1-like [Leptopilina heterotoma]|uniref:ribonuclease H1-like n=1 Tax=Leptopilina heterotoma TaxID=63436 RepID=UPI001CA89227|nr:ribonuclease H1-like [Leptopilina heterotoma]